MRFSMGMGFWHMSTLYVRDRVFLSLGFGAGVFWVSSLLSLLRHNTGDNASCLSSSVFFLY